MSLKKRTKKEIEDIINDSANGLGMYEISKKYSLSERALYDILSKANGIDPYDKQRKQNKTKVKRLEAKIKEQEEEIKLLRSALKKY